MDDFFVKYFTGILSTITIFSCAFQKIPQIVSVRERRSADGVYLQAILMETTGFTIMTLYNFTNDYGLLTYLEYPVLLIQIYALLYYVLRYKRMSRMFIVHLVILLYVAVIFGFLFNLISKDWLKSVLPICTPLSGVSKVTYIYGMYMAGNADNVSLVTWIISMVTNMMRILTVYLDSGDLRLIVNFSVSSGLSASVLAAAMYYQYCVPPPPPPNRPRRKPTYRGNSENFSKYD